MLSLVGEVTAVTWISVGVTVSIVKELIERALLGLLALSVTIIVQLMSVASERVLKVIVLLSFEAEVVELLQLPPYVMAPASFELKV